MAISKIDYRTSASEEIPPISKTSLWVRFIYNMPPKRFWGGFFLIGGLLYGLTWVASATYGLYKQPSPPRVCQDTLIVGQAEAKCDPGSVGITHTDNGNYSLECHCHPELIKEDKP